MKWNLTEDGSAWVIRPTSVNEIGCIHTCQGLEVEYVGVIIGDDLVVRDGEIMVDPSKRDKNDRTIRGYKSQMDFLLLLKNYLEIFPFPSHLKLYFDILSKAQIISIPVII
ncbi:DUF2075 domain-containing protein [Algoriphagus sp. H41]|uniref:DUF2075 domain-containing protein n=1 Tax=Algoriphagus oliviformis TaxID=2811231 RepID=A0ABS3BXG4_9BACT|nr:DUF2075 domain-containing protein [Algoriphagus oliviformis]